MFQNSIKYFQKDQKSPDAKIWIAKAQNQLKEIDELFLNFREPEKYKLSNSTFRAAAAATSIIKTNISNIASTSSVTTTTTTTLKRLLSPKFDELPSKKKRKTLYSYRDSQLPHDECDKILEIIDTSTFDVPVYNAFKTPIKKLKSYNEYTKYVKRPISFPNIIVYMNIFYF